MHGNDGTHTMGEPITTGTASTLEVLEALASLSDHLPVIVDYTIGERLPGDVDGDDAVAFGDFLLLARNYGSVEAWAAQGDIDNDQAVGFSDFVLLADHFGEKLDVSTVSVPEPSIGLSFALLFIWLAGFVGKR